MFVQMNGEKVQELRKERGFSKRALAKKAGVVEHTIKRAEDSQRMMPQTVRLIAGALRVDPQSLGTRSQRS